MSLAEVFRLHGRFRPTRTALVDAGRRLDFAALDRAVDRFARAAGEAGLGRGRPVGVALSDSADHLIALLGLARLGAVILPVDRRWSDAEIAAVARSFAADRVLVEAHRPGDDPAWLRPDADWFAPAGEAYADAAVGPDSPLLFALSSGTTGTPKGPVITHRQFEARFVSYWVNLGFSAADTYVSATPLYFGGGRGFALGTLFSGATVSMFPPPFAPADLVDHVNDTRATTLFLVPTLLRRILSLPDAAARMPTLRCLISSGSALYPQERAEIRRRITPNLYEMYSSSEGGAVSVLPPEDAAAHGDTVGRPAFRVAVEIVDADDRPVPRGAVGRMRYRGPGVPAEFRGAAPEAFRDGWLYPGDLAEMDDNGFIHLRGRAKDMIIRGGVNIYPGDVEAALLSSGLIAEAAVVGVPHRELGETVVAFVTGFETGDDAGLLDWCRQRLAAYKVPGDVVRIDALPRNAGGKVLKGELLSLYERRQGAPR